MWSTLGEWLAFPAVLLLIVLGLAAGSALTKLIFEGLGALPGADEAGRRSGGRQLTVVRAVWVLRLVAVVSVPVLGAAYVAAGLRLLSAGTGTLLLLALPFTAVAVPLFLSPLFLWDHGAAGRAGLSVMVLAAFALLAAFFAGGWALQLGLVQWRGSETTCSVSLGDGRAIPDAAGGDTVLYTYSLDCAAADAPVEMKTYTQVRSERTRVVYDPSGLTGVAHEAELDDLAFTVRFAAGATILWTVSGLGNVLRGIPLARNPNAWP